MTITEIKERLRKVTGHLYPRDRAYFRKCSLEELMETFARMEKGLKFWGISRESTPCDWRDDPIPERHEWDSYTRACALRDELAERLNREGIHDLTDYDS